MRANRILALIYLLLGMLNPAGARFEADEFDASILGSQWTWIESSAPGSSWTLTGSALSLTAAPGGDQFFNIDSYAALEQDAPSGTGWEVETCIQGFEPLLENHKRALNKTGLFLWQDRDHWIGLAVLADEKGEKMALQGFYQLDPVANRMDPRYFGENHLQNITSATLYLKIRKTPDGYQGFVSDDRTSWTSVTPLVRNPQTYDGEMRSEKVRLFASGGPAKNSGVPDDALFDYVRAQSIAVQTRSFKPDEFDGNALHSDIWQYDPGFQPGNYRVADGRLHLTAGPENDQWFNYDRASFVYQPCPTSPHDWAIVVRAAPNDLRGHPRYSGYGLMIWQDQNDWILISNLVDPNNEHLVETGYDRPNAVSPGAVRNKFGTRLFPEYLRISKEGTVYRCAYSYDNERWFDTTPEGVDFGTALQNAQVRLFAKRASKDAEPPLTIQFDWIRLMENKRRR